MGPSAISMCYQLNIGTKPWGCSIMSKAIKHMSVHYHFLRKFYWNTLLKDVQDWMKKCRWCQTSKGLYIDLETPIKARNPMDLLCKDFMKVHPHESSKEDFLAMTGTFSKFEVAV